MIVAQAVAEWPLECTFGTGERVSVRVGDLGIGGGEGEG